MTIRTMTIEDYEGVYELWMTIKGFAIRSIDDSRLGVERFLRRNADTSVVALEDGRLVGSILCGQALESFSFPTSYFLLFIKRFNVFFIEHKIIGALSYLIQNPGKPIVITGSQKPINQEITDAKRNLRDSIAVAMEKKNKL